MKNWQVRLCTFLFTFGLAYSANILGVFVFPGASHFNYNEAIMKSLHSAGHRITFLTTFVHKAKSSENFTVVDSSGNVPNLVGALSATDVATWTTSKRIQFLLSYEEKYCSEMMKLQVIKDALSSKIKFDVMMIQIIFMPQCFLKIAEVLKIPVIGTVAFKDEFPLLDMGNPINPSVIPSLFSGFTSRMSFVERLTNIWYYILINYIDDTTIHPKVNKFCRQYFPETPGPPKISPSLIFLNGHLSIGPRPLIPNFIEIGGIHIRPAQPLNPMLQNFIEEAEHGVILFTFGSVVKPSDIPAEVKSAFIEAFASIPQKVIWKYDEPIDNISENVLLTDWIPQRDILEHENVIAFISHCGQSGMLEAIHTATPVIATPLFADQPSNARLLQEAGVAVHLPALTATKEQILDALNTIVNDTRYYENMQKLSKRFKDRPLTPEESVVYWTEYVIRHEGAYHMRPVAADMPFYQYFLLDVILFVISVTAIILYVFYFIFTKIRSFKHCPKSTKQE